MRRIFFVVVTMIISATFRAGAQDLSSVLNRYYEAIGIQNLLNTRTIIMKGMVKTMNQEFPTTMYKKRPDMIRIESEVQGTMATKAYDGEDGWSVMPLSGIRDPRDLDPEQTRQLKKMTDLEGDLFNWKAKGFKVSLRGRESLDGNNVFSIDLEKPSGDKYTYYLDTRNYLVVREDSHVTVDGSRIDSQTYFLDYRRVKGMNMPFMIKSEIDGQVASSVEIYEIKVNEPIEDSFFKKPAAR